MIAYHKVICYTPRMELITAEEYENQPSDAELEEQARLDEYHEIMARMQGDLPPRGIPKIPGLDRKRVMQAFQDSFELIGGVPRLALWANEHPKEFYQLYAKLMPSTSLNMIQQNNTVIKHVLPRSALDD